MKRTQLLVVASQKCLGDKISIKFEEFEDGTNYYGLYYVDERTPIIEECKEIGVENIKGWLTYWIETYSAHTHAKEKIMSVYKSFIECYQHLLNVFTNHLEVEHDQHCERDSVLVGVRNWDMRSSCRIVVGAREGNYMDNEISPNLHRHNRVHVAKEENKAEVMRMYQPRQKVFVRSFKCRSDGTGEAILRPAEIAHYQPGGELVNVFFLDAKFRKGGRAMHPEMVLSKKVEIHG